MHTTRVEEPVVTQLGDDTAPHSQKVKKPEKRPVLLRLFGISAWGVIKLAAVCILVGFFLLALEFNPTENDVNVLEALTTLIGNLAGAAVWAVKNFWKPLLAGASIVLPLWILWRLISLPFRK